MPTQSNTSVAQLIIRCLENEGVEYVFGIPGEENIHLIDAFNDSSIRFILVRHEQGASFMADIYGRLTGRAADTTVSIIPCPIDYSENIKLTDKLGELESVATPM